MTYPNRSVGLGMAKYKLVGELERIVRIPMGRAPWTLGHQPLPVRGFRVTRS